MLVSEGIRKGFPCRIDISLQVMILSAWKTKKVYQIRHDVLFCFWKVYIYFITIKRINTLKRQKSIPNKTGPKEHKNLGIHFFLYRISNYIPKTPVLATFCYYLRRLWGFFYFWLNTFLPFFPLSQAITKVQREKVSSEVPASMLLPAHMAHIEEKNQRIARPLSLLIASQSLPGLP